MTYIFLIVLRILVISLVKNKGKLPISEEKVLIAYGTRYGATAGTSKEISELLKGDGLDVKVANLKEEPVEDISEYGLVIVGTGLSMGMWKREADEFLKRFHKDLERKKLAIFASTMKTMAEREGKTEQLAKTRKIALDDKVAKYELHPISQEIFGGVIDYNKMNFLTKTALTPLKIQLAKDDFREVDPGVYDLRDWNEIRDWAKSLSASVREVKTVD